MSKRAKPGVDLRAPNPSRSKRLGRSYGAMVYNDHVGIMVTPKKNLAINENLSKKK